VVGASLRSPGENTAVTTNPYPTLEQEGIRLRGPLLPGFEEILTPEALRFVAMLHRRFDQKRRGLLRRRQTVQKRLDAGWRPSFREETANIRDGNWTVEPIPADLQDRRVEITGPVDRKMIIHALNSGARVFMADFEDSTSPTWENVIGGQIHLRDAVRRSIEFPSPDGGPPLRLNDEIATLVVRPRGWHLPEWHVNVDGRAVSGALFDFGLFFFHNARELIARGSGPYFYLPKLEDHREARVWNEVFVRAQRALKIPAGTIKATVLIETILAAFEMHEILFALREHAAGLNCGRWDYIFSFIKKFSARPEFVLPDRVQVTMDRHFLHSYTRLVVQTCHRRRAYAIGGMAAQIPVRADAAANRIALEKVVADKTREVNDGHDGTWVAHPGLVRIVTDIFHEGMPGPHQLGRLCEDVHVVAEDLLSVPEGTITEAGLRLNLNVGIIYLESWLRGKGCVPIHNLMEDAATAEISRSQVWQWLRHGAHLADGRAVTIELYRRLLEDESAKLRDEVGERRWAEGRYVKAIEILDALMTARKFVPFMTIPAYDALLGLEGKEPATP